MKLNNHISISCPRCFKKIESVDASAEIIHCAGCDLAIHMSETPEIQKLRLAEATPVLLNYADDQSNAPSAKSLLLQLSIAAIGGYAAFSLKFLNQGLSGWILILVCAGIALGWFGTVSPWALGIATMSYPPLKTIFEMMFTSIEHNLFPIEFVIYGLMTIPAILGAYLGRFAKQSLFST